MDLQRKRAFLEMKKDELRVFLRSRGIVVSGESREELAERAYWAEKLGLKQKVGDKEAEEMIAKKKKRKLTLDGGLVQLPRPETLKGCTWEDSLVSIPSTTREQIDDYIRAAGRNLGLLNTKGTKTLALGKGLHLSQHVCNLSYNGISPNISYCYIRAKVIPQTKTNGEPYFTWIVLNKDNGQIITAECNCIVGCSDDLDLITEIKRLPSLINVSPKRLSSWEVVINKEDMRVWKRPIENTCLYEFKVCGCFTDISAKSLFSVQLDLEYRKVWDKYVIHLDCVEKDEDSGSEVIHWVTHFPFPLQSRDYVYTRRHKVDHKKKTMMLVSRAIDHPTRPASDKHVRVTTYFSQMVIKPHRSFDESGFDYVLTYHDDPPSLAVNWVTHKGCPDYVSKLHTAAKQLEERNSSTQICLPQQTSKVKEVTGDDSQSYTRGHFA